MEDTVKIDLSIITNPQFPIQQPVCAINTDLLIGSKHLSDHKQNIEKLY